jgi:hypothetical protein
MIRMKNRDMPSAPIIDSHGVFIMQGLPSIGLTKREYFAGLAMQGLLAGDTEGGYSRASIIEEAILQADHILAALEDNNNVSEESSDANK